LTLWKIFRGFREFYVEPQPHLVEEYSHTLGRPRVNLEASLLPYTAEDDILLVDHLLGKLLCSVEIYLDASRTHLEQYREQLALEVPHVHKLLFIEKRELAQ